MMPLYLKIFYHESPMRKDIILLFPYTTTEQLIKIGAFNINTII